MHDYANISIKVRNYKSFGDQSEGYDRLLPFNLLIGRNNVGKSALLDVVEFATGMNGSPLKARKGRPPIVTVSQPLHEEWIEKVFPRTSSGSLIPAANFFDYGRRWIGMPIVVALRQGNHPAFVSVDPPFTTSDNKPISRDFGDRLASITTNPFAGKRFLKISAERDIVRERKGVPDVLPNGSGATDLARSYSADSRYNRKLLTETLLGALNEIVGPDIHFTEVMVLHNQDDQFEIYLGEEGKEDVALSDSGSGLKTIILVLLNIHILPNYRGVKAEDCIFAFEELENNLHPSLQRNLFNYLKKFQEENGGLFFITSHSNVTIDLFSQYEGGQILHVTRDGESSKVTSCINRKDNVNILHDLDFRASDLLQSNGLIWVEGPSDRIYINRWIELASGGELKEGVHYQCVFYGGKLLAHLTAGKEDELVSVLQVNHNAILLMDSDRRKKDDIINQTKQRIIREFTEQKCLTWVTAGKEIENYLPATCIAKLYSLPSVSNVGSFRDFATYLQRITEKALRQAPPSKPVFAENISHYLSLGEMATMLDWEEKIELVCGEVRRWNRIS